MTLIYGAGYLLLDFDHAQVPFSLVIGLITPALLPTALAGPCSRLLVVLSAPLLSWLHSSSLGNPS